MKTAKSKPIQILFVIPPNANLFDFAGAVQVFHEASEQGVKLELKFCSFEAKIKTATNIPLGKIDSYKKQKISKGDYIFIVSADIHYLLSPKLKLEKEFLIWLVNSYNLGANICSLCNGAFILGKTKLLDGKNCTTHWKRTAELQKQFPLAKVHENIIYVEDDRIITSAGATSGVDVALFILSKLTDDYFTYKISRELVIYNRRNGSSPQQNNLLNYRNHVHVGIHKVQDWLNTSLDKKINIPYLAEIAMMSERNFTRMFKKETQLTVNEYITLLRKEKINDLLKKPDLSREQIAKLCGLKSVRHLSRIIHAN
jgi:transcriptional regulator GlxA family with amidase domain